jgi:dihydroneopterin aldolase / 2-amino-4-hydroxy-6-hydroxymethyldihydropteridine diphosphokinase
MALVYLGLGSNLGDRKGTLTQAIELLSANESIHLGPCSEFIDTEPWGVLDQPQFLNAVLELETCLSAEDLLDVCLEVEIQLGRNRSLEKRWGPRSMDIDILFYDNLIVNTGRLQCPHPALHERYFVLKPLSQLAPHLLHPVLKQSVLALLEQLV